MEKRKLVQGSFSWPYTPSTSTSCAVGRGRGTRWRQYARVMMSLQSCRVQWTNKAAIQGTDSAIAAIEAGECIDTGDEGLVDKKRGNTSIVAPVCI